MTAAASMTVAVVFVGVTSMAVAVVIMGVAVT
jgi:hypothetical protein